MTVTIQSALTAVQASAGRLREAVGELTLMAVEDRPGGTEIHLVTVVHDAALEAAAAAEQADAAVRSALPSGVDFGKSQTAQAIAECEANVHALGVVLVDELAAPARLRDLAAFSRERGREAGAWAREIVRCIEACQHLLWTDIQPALLDYWRELAETTNRTHQPSDDR